MLDSGALARLLPVGRFGDPLQIYRSIGSTNDRAAELAQAGAPEGATVLASEQTAGRGRHGRSWDTPEGAGLALSVVLRPPTERAAGLSLIGGLGVVAALAEFRLRARIKWPNDVLLEGRKLAGVLAEASWKGNRLASVVLGIGINLVPTQQLETAEYEYPATALQTHLEQPPDPHQLVRAVLQGLETWYARHLNSSAHPDWERHLAFRGQPVELLPDASAAVEGQVLGLTASGGLRLEHADGSVAEYGSGRLRPLESGSG